MSKIISIQSYSSSFKNNTFIPFAKENGYETEMYSFFGIEKNFFPNKIQLVAREFICLIKCIFWSGKFRNNKVYCLGGHFSALLVCKLLHPFLGKGFRIYIYNFYLHKMGDKKIIQRLLRFLFSNPKCTLIVQSPKEREYYRSITTIPIAFIPFCYDPPYISPEKKALVKDINYIFAGGYTNRDYNTLIETAKRLPEKQFVIAVSSSNKDILSKKLPDNISLFIDIPKIDFEHLVSQAEIIIIPLKYDVGSSGQMLCISGMHHSKPIIYTDISAINYYFTTPTTGMPYQLGNSESLYKVLCQLIDNPDLCKELGENARKSYLQNYTSECRNTLMLEVIK